MLFSWPLQAIKGGGLTLAEAEHFPCSTWETAAWPGLAASPAMRFSGTPEAITASF